MRKDVPAKKNQNTANIPCDAVQPDNTASDWLWQLSVDLSKSRLLKILILLVLIASFFGYFPTRGDDYDVWWHLALGKYYVQNHTMTVDHSIFSWTPADKDWIYNTWLGSTILYLAHSVAGNFGLWLIQYGVLLSVFLLFVVFVKLMGDLVDINYLLGFLLVGITLGLTAVYTKPEMFTTLLFALTVFIYFYGKLFEKKKVWFVYPFLFVLWVNVHGGFLAGLMFLSVALFGEAANSFIFKNLKRERMSKDMLLTLFITLSLSYLAVLINPYGIKYHISVLHSLLSAEYMKSATKVVAYLSMWGYVFPKQTAYRFIMAAWCILIMAFAFTGLNIFAYRKKKFIDPALIFINLFFLYFSMKAARYTIYFPIVNLYSIFHVLKKADLFQFKARTTIVAIIIMSIFAVYTDFSTVFYQPGKTWFGQGLENSLPVKEVAFIMKNKIQGPLYNDYLIGGYMMWKMYPDYKVFIDPRYGPYWKEVGPDYFRFAANANIETLHQLVQKYPFKAALIHMRETPLIFFMVNTGEWRIAYLDKVAVVLIHKSLIPTLSKEALSTDMSPARFRDINNPDILQNAFNYYVAIGPQYGRLVMGFYKKNVSELYWGKEQGLAAMQAKISSREQEIMQRQAQQAQQAKAQGKAEVL